LNPDLDTVFIQAKLFFMVERLEYLKKYTPSSVDELSQSPQQTSVVQL
jgi:hypothetical protein